MGLRTVGVMTVVLGCASILTAGCMTTAHYGLPQGKSNEDFQQRLAYCRMQSQMRPQDPNMDGFMAVAMMQLFIDNCLRAEGYSKID